MSDFVIVSATNFSAPFFGIWETQMQGWADASMPSGQVGLVEPEPTIATTVCYLPTRNQIMIVAAQGTPETWFDSVTLQKIGEWNPNTYNRTDATFQMLQDNGQPGGAWPVWFWDLPNLDFDDGFTTAVTFDTGITMPDLVDDPLAGGTAELIGLGLVVGAISFASSAVHLAGAISAQSVPAGDPVVAGTVIDLVISTGPAQGPISKLTQKILIRLHRVFDKNPYPQLAFRLQYDGTGMTWQIANGVLTTTVTAGTGSDLSIPLSAFTVDSLAAMLGALPGYSVPFQDTSEYAQLGALVLMDGSNDINTSNGDHIYGYTNLLWAYIETVGAELGAAKAQIPNMLAQMTVPTAEDEWLDEHGSYYLVPRRADELDAAYAARMVQQVLQPKGNNVAIAMVIQALAPDALNVRVIDSINDLIFTITYNGLIAHNGTAHYDAGLGPDSGYGFFDVDFDYDFTGSVTQDTYFDLIVDTVPNFRDAGTQLRGIIFRNNGSTHLIVSDTIVDGIRVIVYDDFSTGYRLLENGLVRLLEDGTARLLE